MKKILLASLTLLISLNVFALTPVDLVAMGEMRNIMLIKASDTNKPCPRCCPPWEQPDPCCKKC